MAVYEAVSAGRLPHISTQSCVDCGEPATMYHHPRGYSDEHVLDVEPVCPRCHKLHEHVHEPGDVHPRLTIEFYDDEVALIPRIKVAALIAGVTLREWTMEAVRLRLERDGADRPPAP
jgi:hypothetical protein